MPRQSRCPGRNSIRPYSANQGEEGSSQSSHVVSPVAQPSLITWSDRVALREGAGGISDFFFWPCGGFLRGFLFLRFWTHQFVSWLPCESGFLTAPFLSFNQILQCVPRRIANNDRSELLYIATYDEASTNQTEESVAKKDNSLFLSRGVANPRPKNKRQARRFCYTN